MYTLTLVSGNKETWSWKNQKINTKGAENNYEKKREIIPNSKSRNCLDFDANCKCIFQSNQKIIILFINKINNITKKKLSE